MLLRNILALTLLTASSAILADTFDINLRDNSVQLQYGASMGRDSLGSSQLHMGFLYTSDNDRFGDLGLLVKGTVGNGESGMTAGVGVKGLLATVQGHNAGAIALGGQMRFSPASDGRLGFVGQLYFSPNITTYRDAERYAEGVARVEYDLIPQATAYVGYRRISFSLLNRPDVVLDPGFHVGVRLTF